MHDLKGEYQFNVLSYWRLSTGLEVDFIVGEMQLAVEAKSSSRVTSDHLKGLRDLADEHPALLETKGKRIVVSTAKEQRTTDDGIRILPAEKFVESLWSGELF